MQTKIHADLQWQMDGGRSQLFQIQICLNSELPDYDYAQIGGLEVFQRRPQMIRARADRQAISALSALEQVTVIEPPDQSWN